MDVARLRKIDKKSVESTARWVLHGSRKGEVEVRKGCVLSLWARPYREGRVQELSSTSGRGRVF